MVKIIVFRENARLINVLNKAKYYPLVDAVHTGNTTWFENNKEGGRGYEMFCEKGVYTIVEENTEDALFWIWCDDFSEIGRFLDYITCLVNDREDLVLKNTVNELFPLGVEGKSSIEYETPEHEDTGYELIWQLIDGKMFYQVERPYTDLPFTTITYDYEKVGHLPFFSSLFISNVWGISKYDIVFLRHIWERFNMDGVFDIDQLVRDRVASCDPSSPDCQPEPVVYRKTIEQVVGNLNRKRGFYKD